MDQLHNKQLLAEAALKTTQARLAILTFLHSTSAPVDTAGIINYLHKMNINIDPATIFRTMNTFTKMGITREIQFHEGKRRYELAKVAEHHHLVCERCGGIEDISNCSISLLEKDIAKKKNFLIKRHSLEFFGVCSLCQS